MHEPECMLAAIADAAAGCWCCCCWLLAAAEQPAVAAAAVSSSQQQPAAAASSSGRSCLVFSVRSELLDLLKKPHSPDIRIYTIWFKVTSFTDKHTVLIIRQSKQEVRFYIVSGNGNKGYRVSYRPRSDRARDGQSS
jgi:hypothetical protein